MQQEKAQTFKALHQKGSPIIIFNSWDAGSTMTIADQGAKAIALGSHGVAEANGYEDGENIPLDIVLANARRSVDAVSIPVSLDFEAGYGVTPDDVKQSVLEVIKTGVIGINIEDQKAHGEGLYSTDEQAARLQAVRAAADEAGVDLFINARTDLFKNADPADHTDALLDEALERALAFAEAGASGFFVPLLQDVNLIQRLCDESPLPVNILWIDGSPDPADIAAAGASRISYGPGPYLKMNQWLKTQAQQALLLQK